MSVPTVYTIPSAPAGSCPLLMQLYSEHKLNIDSRNALSAKLNFVLQHKTQNHVLIIGGKCGMTAELLIPFCSRIDIVQEEPFLNLLEQRFVNRKDIKYTFCREGYIGEEHVLEKPDTMKQSQYNCIRCEFNIYEMSKFDRKQLALEQKQQEPQHKYNVILLQNVLINNKMNILEELLRIEHEILITMIIPGKLHHKNLFELLAGIEKNILQVFYEHELHERLQNAKYITGRRQEILFWEIFVWRKKPVTSEEGALSVIQQVKKLLDIQIEANKVESQQMIKGPQSYETKQLVQMYYQFHYNDEEYFTVKNFPLTCGEKALEIADQANIPTERALDIGCALGRTSIVLAQKFSQVIGVDYSNAFVEAATKYLSSNEKLPQSKVKFFVGDACKLDPSLGKFSLVFGGNLIDRLSDPEQFLMQISEFIEPNGILMLTSPYSWLEEWTPKEKWIGGYYSKDDKDISISTQEGLSRILTKDNKFKQFKNSENVRFVIKENNWVFQYTLANVTYWQKN